MGRIQKETTMNRETALKYTTSYEENLIERLKDPELARAYLEAALESYEADYDTEALLLAMHDVARAQEDIGKLAECGGPSHTPQYLRTDISCQHLYDVLANKHTPRLDNPLDILLGLGFRIRLERRDIATEQSTSPCPRAEIK
jgi:DNA-binding phage protein